MRLGSNGKADGGQSLVTRTTDHVGDIVLTLAQLRRVPTSGSADAAIEVLLCTPSIALQAVQWKTVDLIKELEGYGAWSDAELSDHYQNIRRFLWCVINDIKEDIHVG